MRSLLNMLQKENGRLSVARVCTIVAFVVWICVTLYTAILGKNYAHYDTMTIAMLVMMFVILCSKAVDSKLITIKGDDTNVTRNPSK